MAGTLANSATYTQSSSVQETQFTLPTPVTEEGRYEIAVYNASSQTALTVIVYVHSGGEQSEDRAEVARFTAQTFGIQNGIAQQVKGLGLYDTTYWVKTVAQSSFSTNFGVTVKVFNMG
jgi:hypothetical protein